MNLQINEVGISTLNALERDLRKELKNQHFKQSYIDSIVPLLMKDFQKIYLTTGKKYRIIFQEGIHQTELVLHI